MKTKILFSSNSLKRGGKERQLTLLFSSLNSDKFEKHILCKNLTPNNYLEEYSVNQNQISVTWKLRGFYRILKSFNPDIVWGWDMISVFYLLILSPFFSYKIVNGSIRHGIRGKKLTHYLRSFIAWISPWVVANSEAGLYVNNMKKSKKRLVLYNGIETHIEKLDKEEKKQKLIEYFKDYNSEDELVFISIANLVPYKDYNTVLSAMYELKDIVKFRYFILGDGPLRKKTEDIIATFGLRERVYLAGRVNNVNKYLELSDIMIHSSRGEGVSNAILEGMFAGLPIIAARVGGIPETVYSKGSLLFPYADKNVLKKHLLSAKSFLNEFDPKEKEYLHHLQKFTKESMLENFEKVIKQIVDNESL